MTAEQCHFNVGDTLIIEVDVEGMPTNKADLHMASVKAKFAEVFQTEQLLVIPMNKIHITVLSRNC